MKVRGEPMRTIFRDGAAVVVIDQRRLPHALVFDTLRTLDDTIVAIADMTVRGAPLIGVTAAYGLALQAGVDSGDGALQTAGARLKASRPTAVNLAWAVDRVLARLLVLPAAHRPSAAWALAAAMADEDVATNAAIGRHGAGLLRTRAAERGCGPGQPLQVLTHCNAGWLATVDWGTALAPIYRVHDDGLPVHVWVDETRPRNQGASLTTWELGQHGVPHTLIADNAGGHLMQRGEVDLVIVGCDRVTARGDVCNKIGTYLKALAAHDNGVPFLVAMPWSTFDPSLDDGVRDVPIEERSAREVTHLSGRHEDGSVAAFAVAPEGTRAANPAFDVTPARLVTALVTQSGVVPAQRAALAAAHGAFVATATTTPDAEVQAR